MVYDYWDLKWVPFFPTQIITEIRLNEVKAVFFVENVNNLHTKALQIERALIPHQ